MKQEQHAPLLRAAVLSAIAAALAISTRGSGRAQQHGITTGHRLWCLDAAASPAGPTSASCWPYALPGNSPAGEAPDSWCIQQIIEIGMANSAVPFAAGMLSLLQRHCRRCRRPPGYSPLLQAGQHFCAR
jgi:hypothetical protein